MMTAMIYITPKQRATQQRSMRWTTEICRAAASPVLATRSVAHTGIRYVILKSSNNGQAPLARLSTSCRSSVNGVPNTKNTMSSSTMLPAEEIICERDNRFGELDKKRTIAACCAMMLFRRQSLDDLDSEDVLGRRKELIQIHQASCPTRAP